MSKINTKQWVLKTRPEQNGPLVIQLNEPDSTFKLIDSEIDTGSLKDGEVVVETLYFSNDPAQKDWLNPGNFSYAPKPPINSIVPSRGLVRVIESKSSKYSTGTLLNTGVGWTTHTILKDDDPLTFAVPTIPGISEHHLLGSLGLSAITAYFTLFKYSSLDPTKDEGKTFMITGAAGGVGSFIVTLASKVFKASKIYAIAGGDAKVEYVESLGDNIIGVDYKSSDFNSQLKKLAGENSIDVIIDSVGGEILDLGLELIKPKGNIVLLGATSDYFNNNQISNGILIVLKSLTIRGFVILDDMSEFQTATGELIRLVTENNIDLDNLEYIEDIKGDFSLVPQLWYGLFQGLNKGKFLTKIK